MENKNPTNAKSGKKLLLIGGIVALIVVIILLLTMCGPGLVPVSSMDPDELAALLAEEGDQAIRLDADVVVAGPLQINGNKTITGSGKIILSTAQEGQWPDSDAPTWGMGCAKLKTEDASQMPAVLVLSDGASLTLSGSVTIDAGNNANGVLVPAGTALTVADSAQIVNGRYANLVVLKDAKAKLAGGTLTDGGVHNVINLGTVELTGSTLTGAKGGAVIYTEGTLTQSGGTISGATFHNVYVAAGTFTMSGGANESAAKDGVLVADGAQANVTGGTIHSCIHGLCNNGDMTVGALVLTECGIMNYETGVLELNGTTVDTSEVYCLSNNGGKVTATDFTAIRCDTVAVYNFSGDIVLNNLKISGSRDGNIANAGGNMTVNGATLESCRDKSITVGNGVAIFNNVTVEGTSREKYGVYAYGGELYMNDCTIRDVSSTAVKVDAGSHVELNNVAIKDVQQNGFQLDGGKIVANNVTMENMGSHGIYNNGGEVTGDGLTIKTVDKNIIQNKSGTATLKNVTAENAGNHGAYVEAGTLTIQGGSFTTMAANGFYLPEGEGKLVLENVTITDTVQQGINNSATVEVKNVSISDTDMNGIYNKAGGKVTINGLKVTNVAEHGINNKASMTAVNVTIKNTGYGSNGIQNNGTMKLTNASITNSKNHGLYNTGTLTASDVTINGTSKNGVYNDKGTSTIEGLSVTNTGEHGINNAATLSATKVDISVTGKGKNGVQNSGVIELNDCRITQSKNHGIYNTGTVSGKGITISDVADNGIYNSKGTVNAITSLQVSNTGGQGVNNTGSFTASDVNVSGTGKNGIYTNGGKTNITGLTVTDPGEHGVSNDFNGVVTLSNVTLTGSGDGENGIQNKATMTVSNVTIKNSSNHGIYNDSKFTATGTLTVTGSAVNGIYNYGGTVDIASLNIQGTKGATSESHGVNNDGTMTIGTLTVSKAAYNGIQNKGELTITGSATLTDAGQHGMYNGGTLEAKNVTVTNAGDLLMNNGAEMTIHGLKLSGSANKAIYNAGYAELYSATVDGAKVDNVSNPADQFLVDNNGGILDLNDATIFDAKGTALHNRGKARTSVTNVIIDGAGNYGIFVGGSSVVFGDGLVVNNVTKNSAVSGAEGYGIKNQGKITMMDHVTIGAYDDTVTGDGITARKSTSGIASTALTNDAATSSYSGLDLTIKNSGGNGVYNKGTMYVTDLVIDKANHGLVTRYASWITVSGTATITNIKNNPVSIYGPEGKGYVNGVTLTTGTTLTIDTAGSHGINNKGTFEAAADTKVTVKNITGKQVNAINNNGGKMTLDDVEIDGVYVTISKNGNSINTNSGNGLQTNNKLTLNGDVVIKNLFYKAEGGLNDNSNGTGLVVKGSGSVTGTGSVTIIGNQTVPKGYEGYVGMYNGVYNEKRTIQLDGDLTISGVANNAIENCGKLDVADITITAVGKRAVNNYNNGDVKGNIIADSLTVDGFAENAIQNSAVIDIAGAVKLSNNTTKGHGMYNSGTFDAGSLEISNVKRNGINNAGTLCVDGLVKITNAVEAGAANTKTFQAGSVEIDTVTNGHGIQNNNRFTVTGSVVLKNIAKRGVNNYGSGNLSAGSISIDGFGENGIQNAATITVTGAVSVSNDNVKGHGIYNTKNLTCGSLTISNIVRKGLNNDGGTVKINGDLLIENVGEEGIRNVGTLTVLGNTTVRNITATDVNAIQNYSGKTMNLGGNLVVDNIKVTVSDDKTNVGNGLYTEGTVVLGGTASISDIFTTRQDNTVGVGVLPYKGGQVKGTGSIVITGAASTDTAYPYGINNGIFLNGDNKTPVINLTGDITVSYVTGRGVYLANEVIAEDGSVTSTAKLTARNITTSNTGKEGVNNRYTSNELTATGTIYVSNAGGNGIANGGVLKAAQIIVDRTADNGIYNDTQEGNGSITVTGAITVSNATNHGINNPNAITAGSIALDTIGKNGVNNNNGTINVSGAITGDNVGGHGVSNNKTLNAASVTITNAGTSSGNGIQNNGNNAVMTVTGTVSVDTVVNGHGIYNGKTVSFGAFTSANTSKNGINNGGSMTVTGAITVSGAGADGVSNGGGKTLTAGSLTVKDVSGKDGNAVNNSGTMTLDSLTVQNINYTITKDEKGNGLFNKGTLNLNGNATIQNVTTSSNTADTKCNGILNAGTITCNGQITITVDTIQRHGIYLNGGSITGANATVAISNTTQNGILMYNGATLSVAEVSINRSNNNGIQITDDAGAAKNNTLTVDTVKVQDIKSHGVWAKNNSQPTITIGTLVANTCGGRGLSANNDMSTANLNVTNLYWVSCSEGAKGNLTDCITNIYNTLPAEAAASAVEEN